MRYEGPATGRDAAKRKATACIAVAWIAAGLAAMAGCAKPAPAPLFEKAAVEKRTIVVSASASGAIEPVRTVDVKSKASGEIIQLNFETGDDVESGRLLAVVDPRQPRNTLAQAQANLEVARAQLSNAKAEMARADTLFKTQAITETEHETARLAYVNANAQVVRAQTDVENAQDQMEDTELRAPVTGTIIAKNVELGTVISSPTKDVGGGTVLLRMANLDTVQVRTLVDETDIGKVQPGLAASIVVDAYPNRTFEGEVLKIEPMATVQQNVTMFPVLVRIANPGHLLKPGMNTEVEVHVGRREDMLAIPYSALRTKRDVASAASVLGLDPAAVDKALADAAGKPAGADSSAAAASPGPGPGTASAAENPAAKSGGTLTLPDGRTIPLPAGVTEADVQAAMHKRMGGQELSAAEQSMLRKVFAGAGGGRGGGHGRGMGGGSAGGENGDAGKYIVFVLRNGQPTPVEIRTGLTDLDYIEVTGGLTEQDTVAVLPSASLVNSQKEMQQRLKNMPGAGGLPGMSSSGNRSGSTR